MYVCSVRDRALGTFYFHVFSPFEMRQFHEDVYNMLVHHTAAEIKQNDDQVPVMSVIFSFTSNDSLKSLDFDVDLFIADVVIFTRFQQNNLRLLNDVIDALKIVLYTIVTSHSYIFHMCIELMLMAYHMLAPQKLAFITFNSQNGPQRNRLHGNEKKKFEA